jgi:DNA polymerase-3 subunit epsilon
VPSGRRHERGVRTHIEAQAHYLAELVGRLDGRETNDPDAAAYLDVLDRALEDRRLTGDEAKALHDTAREWGLSEAATTDAHVQYLDALCDVAVADGSVTEAERSDLELVAHLLNVTGRLESSLRAAFDRQGAAEDGPRESLRGLSVCFTGALAIQLGNGPVTRETAERLAAEAGLHVLKNVSRKLDLLVVADPDTQSGKARRARDLGIRIMAEEVFWQRIGVEER